MLFTYLPLMFFCALYKALPKSVTAVPNVVVRVMMLPKYREEQHMIKALFAVFRTDIVTGEY